MNMDNTLSHYYINTYLSSGVAGAQLSGSDMWQMNVKFYSDGKLTTPSPDRVESIN